MSSNEPTRSNAAGAAMTYSKQANQIRAGDYIVIREFPCQVIRATCIKNGKHGHAKALIGAKDIFTSRKYTTMVPGAQNVLAPHVVRTDYPVVCIHDTGMLSLLADDGT